MVSLFPVNIVGYACSYVTEIFGDKYNPVCIFLYKKHAQVMLSRVVSLISNVSSVTFEIVERNKAKFLFETDLMRVTKYW